MTSTDRTAAHLNQGTGFLVLGRTLTDRWVVLWAGDTYPDAKKKWDELVARGPYWPAELATGPGEADEDYRVVELRLLATALEEFAT